MKYLYFILILLILTIIGCAENKSLVTSSSIDKDIKNLSFKINNLESHLIEIYKKIDIIDKKLDNITSKYNKCDEKEKLIVAEIENFKQNENNTLTLLANINNELAQLKKKMLSTKRAEKKSINRKVKKVRKKKSLVEENYNKCLTKFRKGDYNKSVICFQKFIKKFKNHKLIPNAYFWIGECYFKQGNFLKAIDNYDIVLTKYPKSIKIPSALLKEGMAFYYMKDKEGAKIFLKKVINEYPNTPQAQYAKSFLKKFGLE